MKKILTVILSCCLLLCSIACSPKKSDTGSVFYLNFKPEADGAWQKLAKEYTQQTGIPVTVVTAAAGEYDTVLTTQMDKKNPPTLFQITSPSTLSVWEDVCLDLDDSDLAKALTTNDFNLYGSDGKLKAIGFCYEAYGLIVNKKLLRKAGYSLDDIQNFADLRVVAEDIHKRKGELGFDAFTSSGLDDSSSWRFSGHLLGLPIYYEMKERNLTDQPASLTGSGFDAFLNLFDLYLANASTKGAALATATGDMAEAEFGQEKAVFFQNGSWEFSALTKDQTKGYLLNPDDLAMIPLYSGLEGEEEMGLCCGTENHWAVNKNASEADQKATLNFLAWVVNSEAGTKLLAEEFGITPFKKTAGNENVFLLQAEEYRKAGKETIPWAFVYTPSVVSFRAAFVDALTAYAVGQKDAEELKAAFVTGWKKNYEAEKGSGA